MARRPLSNKVDTSGTDVCRELYRQANLYHLTISQELSLFDSDLLTSGDDGKMMLKVVPYPDTFFSLDSMLPWHETDRFLRLHLDGDNLLGHTF